MTKKTESRRIPSILARLQDWDRRGSGNGNYLSGLNLAGAYSDQWKKSWHGDGDGVSKVWALEEGG